MTRLPPTSTLFPYTTLFRSYPEAQKDLPQFLKDHADEYVIGIHSVGGPTKDLGGFEYTEGGITLHDGAFNPGVIEKRDNDGNFIGYEDRKSTRLNSSHVAISYAVFCLPKKKRTQEEKSRALPSRFRLRH